MRHNRRNAKVGVGARLGQHFLNAPWVARALVEAAHVSPRDTVLEIGPGKGALTKELLATGALVIAIEKDPPLVEILHETFKSEIGSGRLTIVSADIRDITPEQLSLTSSSYILAANIPYYITGEIMRQFLTAKAQPKTMALLVQKEVAERIARSTKESILSLSVKVYGTPKFVKKVASGNFSPSPSVDSAILLVDDISRERIKNLSEERLFRIIRAGFSSKRKLLTNNLSVIFGKERVLEALEICGIEEKARAETINLEKWINLARYAQKTT